ncbi:hypothetical protein GXM_01908 [Nostoc sphaeroides CCNUC1]|uniref:Uncharacterized protein n=1 Tax=Nostoc sphaeroides CCNUC1 TaxID=2653204 RepID=A0A5P8VVI6_9NOSO|nr:hypothetical protein GXM_01908 [Nostoc sphaeroides CCNUC1]
MCETKNQTPCGRRGAACGRCVRPKARSLVEALADETGNPRDE